MYVGTQYFGTSKLEMEFLVRHGVTHFDATVDNMEVETLTQHKEEATAHGVKLEMVHIKPMDSIPMAKDPQRQKDIDTFCQYIENANQAGLRGLNTIFVYYVRLWEVWYSAHDTEQEGEDQLTVHLS